MKVKEVEVSFMAVIRTLNEKDSELSKLRKKEAIRKMNQGTIREPSAKAKTPLSYQETDEDEKTARNRASEFPAFEKQSCQRKTVSLRT